MVKIFDPKKIFFFCFYIKFNMSCFKIFSKTVITYFDCSQCTQTIIINTWKSNAYKFLHNLEMVLTSLVSKKVSVLCLSVYGYFDAMNGNEKLNSSE